MGTRLQRETLTVTAACQRMGVSRRTLYNWMDAQRVEWLRTAGGTRRVFADSLWRRQDGSLGEGDLTLRAESPRAERVSDVS
jgi:excisionase family DNA binding protein